MTSASPAFATITEATGPLRQWWSLHAASLITVPVRIVVIVVIAVVLRIVVSKLISRGVTHVVQRPTGPRLHGRRHGQAAVQAGQRTVAERRRQRAQTLGSVLRSTATGVIFTIAAVIILGQLGVNLAPIIASIGVIGLAVGFGARSLVSDVIAGMFMLAEDQYGVGDWIDAGVAAGTVEEIGLRTTRLRDSSGALWHIRNGEITAVGNSSQHWSRAFLEIAVSYDTDIDRAIAVLEKAAREACDDTRHRDHVVGDPEVWGVGDLTGEAITLQLAVTTAPSRQWGLARELRRRIKAALDQDGITLAVPQQTTWMRADGDTPITVAPRRALPDGTS